MEVHPVIDEARDALVTRITRSLADASIARYEAGDGRVLEIYESAIGPAVKQALNGNPAPGEDRSER
jgi:hypothetical protein